MSWEIGPWQILACGEQLCVRHCIQRTSHLRFLQDGLLPSPRGCLRPWIRWHLGCRAQAEVVGAGGSCLELGA